MSWKLSCGICGSEFTAGHSYAKYCSDRCRKRAQRLAGRNLAARRDPRVLRCAECGEEFSTAHARKYCSPECRRSATARRSAAQAQAAGPPAGKRMACARCGKWMWKGESSMPEGRATCRECRKAAPVPHSRPGAGRPRTRAQRECPVCGQFFMPMDAPGRGFIQRTCSRSCGQFLRVAERYAGIDPSAWAASRTLRNSVKNARRRAEVIKDPVPYTLAEIARRDGYRCGLCRRKVDMSLSGMERQGPTIDHIVPLSVSKDDRRTNVQLAHRACNIRKHNRVGDVQLMLIG